MKTKVTGVKTNKNEGFIRALISTNEESINSFFVVVFFGYFKIRSCSQNNQIENGNKKIMVELCHTFGTNFPR